jgi:hypothetical protein
MIQPDLGDGLRFNPAKIMQDLMLEALKAMAL